MDQRRHAGAPPAVGAVGPRGPGAGQAGRDQVEAGQCRTHPGPGEQRRDQPADEHRRGQLSRLQGDDPLEETRSDTREALSDGADEIDFVVPWRMIGWGHPEAVAASVREIKDICGGATLKAILETGELGTYDNVRRASLLAMAAGGDFIKTSTGKISPAATLPVTLCMLEAIRDVHEETGRVVGMKPAGGIRTAKQAIQYLVVLHETLGLAWMTPDLFRFGASSLLNDVLMQIRFQRTGLYSSPDYFTID